MGRQTYDVIIAGGGIMGCSIAYHLTKDQPRLKLLVIERDPTYQFASTALCMGGVRVQFSLKENILISLYTQKVLEHFDEEMAVGKEKADVGFRREGYLFPIDSSGEEEARKALTLQKKLGAQVEWWSPDEIEKQYPILDGSLWRGATFGPKDGYLDPHGFLMGYKAKAKEQGAVFVTDSVLSFKKEKNRISGVKLNSGESLEAEKVVNATGGWSTDLAKTVDVTLPVEPVKRQVFAVKPSLVFEKPLPLVILPSGLYFRTETGGLVLAGRSFDDDPVGFDFTWDRKRFEEILWPEMAETAPVFDQLKVVRGWAGLYDVNRIDGNAILGEWPGLKGLYIVCGFSGHGLQQAPAVGRYMAELIIGKTPTLDLKIFSPKRILENRPLSESGIV